MISLVYSIPLRSERRIGRHGYRMLPKTSLKMDSVLCLIAFSKRINFIFQSFTAPRRQQTGQIETSCQFYCDYTIKTKDIYRLSK